MKKLTQFLLIAACFMGGFVFAKSGDTKNEMVVEDVKNMSHDDMKKSAKGLVNEMQETLDATQSLLEQVREEDEDILTLNCINQQLAAIKGFVKVSEQQKQKLAEQDTREAQEHSFTLISVAAAKVRSLGEEAQNCVGEGYRYADKNIIERREDSDIANVEVIVKDDDAMDDAFAKERDPELTPFQ